MFEKLMKFGNKELSTIRDPFNKKGVCKILVSYYVGTFDETWKAYGTVEFRNGNTKGEQKFTGETFDEVVMQIKAFVKTLE